MRLGSSSASYLLPSGARQQGYLHEVIVEHASALLRENLSLAAAVSVRASESQEEFLWRQAQLLHTQQIRKRCHHRYGARHSRQNGERHGRGVNRGRCIGRGKDSNMASRTEGEAETR